MFISSQSVHYAHMSIHLFIYFLLHIYLFFSLPTVLWTILVHCKMISKPGALGLKHKQCFSVWHAVSWWSRCCYFSEVASFVLCDKVCSSPSRALSNVLNMEWHIKQACYPFHSALSNLNFCFQDYHSISRRPWQSSNIAWSSKWSFNRK